MTRHDHHCSCVECEPHASDCRCHECEHARAAQDDARDARRAAIEGGV